MPLLHLLTFMGNFIQSYSNLSIMYFDKTEIMSDFTTFLKHLWLDFESNILSFSKTQYNPLNATVLFVKLANFMPLLAYLIFESATISNIYTLKM